ncbi:hypothetical protein WDW89_25930 [Deltaproteobacteria bacterium TL4]
METFKLLNQKTISIMSDARLWEMIANDFRFTHLHKMYKTENFDYISGDEEGLFDHLNEYDRLSATDTGNCILLVASLFFMEFFLRVAHADNELDTKEIMSLTHNTAYSPGIFHTDLAGKVIENFHSNAINIHKAKAAHHASILPIAKFVLMLQVMYEHGIFPNQQIFLNYMNFFSLDLMFFNSTTAYASGEGVLALISSNFNKSPEEEAAANSGIDVFVKTLNNKFPFKVIGNPANYYI